MSNQIPSFEARLLTCIKQGRVEEAKWIMQTMTDAHKLVDDSNLTLLHYAADYGNGGIAKYLIELGSDVDAQDTQGRTPLMLAIVEERVTTIRVLLENNANIHITDEQGISALHMVLHGSLFCQSTIQAFLNRLKKETSSDSRLLVQILRNIDCPLRVAVFLDDAEVIRLMLDQGDCKVNEPDTETGETALHIAVRLVSLKTVELLIYYGANLNVQTDSGYTPLYNLDVNKDQSLELLKLLLDRGAEMFTEKCGEKVCQISNILENSCRETIRLSIQRGVDLCTIDKYGCTVLHYLARNRNSGVFDELRGKKFDVDVVDSESYTPLLLVSDNLSSLRFLLANGANVHRSRNGVTALIKMFQKVSNREKIHVESVNILLQYGADPQSVFLNETIFDRALRQNLYPLLHSIVAYLALLDETGTPIHELVRSKIENCKSKSIKNYYDLCKLELGIMKCAIVWESITKYKLLTVSAKQLAMYARQQQFRSIVSSDAFHFEFCYIDIGRERVKTAISTAELWESSTTVLCDVLKLCYEKYYDIMENMIINYLSEQDMRNLCLIDEE